jgi:hypothetical protein
MNKRMFGINETTNPCLVSEAKPFAFIVTAMGLPSVYSTVVIGFTPTAHSVGPRRKSRNARSGSFRTCPDITFVQPMLKLPIWFGAAAHVPPMSGSGRPAPVALNNCSCPLLAKPLVIVFPKVIQKRELKI